MGRAQADSVFLLTNRHNMLGMFARDLVVPVGGLEPRRYRRDLLELCPGRLPLSRRGVDTAFAEAVSSDGGESYPVLIEVTGIPADAGPQLHDLWIAPVGVLPITNVVAVHLRTTQEIDEIRVRSFSNVDAASIPYRMSPELFDTPGPGIDEVTSWLSALPPVENCGAGIFRAADAVAGAVSVVTAHAGALGIEAVTLLEFLNDLTSSGATDPCTPQWLTGWIARLVWSDGPPSALDQRLLRPVVTALVAHDPLEDIVASDFLAELRAEVRTDGPGSPDRNLERVLQVVRGEQTFTGLRPEGSVVTKALLLFLLRPTVDGTISWGSEDVGASAGVLMLTYCFAGLTAGLRNLDTGLRGAPGLQTLLARAVADRVNLDAGSSFPLHSAADRPLRADETEEAVTIVDSATSEVLAVLAYPAADEVSPLYDPAPYQDKDRAVAVTISQQLGWNDCLEWEILAEKLTVTPRGKKIVVSVSSSATVQLTLVETAFRERLEQADPADLRVALTTGTGGGAPKPQRRRKPAARAKPKAKSGPVSDALPGISTASADSPPS